MSSAPLPAPPALAPATPATPRRLDAVAILIPTALYVLLGNARSVQMNPFIPGAVVAVNMVVPVLIGILRGPRTGLIVGILGTSLNAISPAGSSFELAAILPHGVMGLTAGWLRDRVPSPLPALALLVGHVLNLIAFAALDLLPARDLLRASLWYGIGSETVVGAVAVSILAAIYRLGFESTPA